MALTREDLQAIKGIVSEGISGLEKKVDNLSDRMTVVEADVKETKDRLTVVEADVKDIKVVQLENRVIPVLEGVVKYQEDVYKRYYEGAKAFEDKIALVDMTAKVVEEHSKQIKELQLKQA